MNLFIFPVGSENFYTSPDTAICREDKNGLHYYIPDRIETLRAIPFAFVKISKAGKCIREEYAHRHYGACGYGIHFSTYDVNEGNMLDNSIFLSEPAQISDKGPYDGFQAFDAAMCKASEYMSLRSGDIVALELEYIEAFEVTPGTVFSLSYKDFEITLHG